MCCTLYFTKVLPFFVVVSNKQSIYFCKKACLEFPVVFLANVYEPIIPSMSRTMIVSEKLLKSDYCNEVKNNSELPTAYCLPRDGVFVCDSQIENMKRTATLSSCCFQYHSIFYKLRTTGNV